MSSRTQSFPVPTRFELPNNDWRAISPEDHGVHGAAFLAVRKASPGAYHPSLTVSGRRWGELVTIEDIAEEQVAQFGAEADQARLLDRARLGGPSTPLVMQQSAGLLGAGDTVHDLRHLQAVLGLIDADDPTERAIVTVTAVCTAAQRPVVAAEFQQFLGTLRFGPAA